MSTGATRASRARLTRYLFDIARLKAIIGLNQKDDGPPPPRFTYFVDADVVVLYSDPSRSGKYAKLFLEQERDEDLAASTAMLAAELIFSGQLPRQSPGESLYMLPDHADELDSVLRAIGRRTGGAAAEDSGIDQLARNLRAAKEKGDLTVRAEEIARDFTLRLSHAQRGALKEVIAFNRLFGNDRIARAESLREMTEDLLAPPLNSVNDWTNRILAYRDPNETLDSRKIERVEHDARALTQLLMLNEECDDDREYVLITGSHRMHRAYSAWRNETAIEMPYFLRHPTQYLPILNAGQLDRLGRGSDSEVARSLFYEIKRALDTLPLIEAESARPYPDYTPGYSGRHSDADAKIEDDAVMQAIRAAVEESDRDGAWIDTFSREWARLSTLALSANAKILNDRLARDDAELVELLIEGRDIFLDRQQSVVEELSNRHLAFNIVAKLIRNYEEKQGKGDRLILRFNRITAPVFTDFTDVVGKRSAIEFLNSLDPALLERVKESLRTLRVASDDIKGAKAAFFASCASARVFALTEARALVNRAEQIFARAAKEGAGEQASSDLHEARYFKAKIDRFDLATPQMFENARALLDELAAEAAGRSDFEYRLKAARAHIERGALGVAAAILCARSPSPAWRDYASQFSAIFAASAVDLCRGSDLLSKSVSSDAAPTAFHEEIARLLTRQLHSNIVSHYLVSELIDERKYAPAFIDENFDRSLKSLDAHSDAPYVVRIEHAVACWLNNREDSARADVLAQAAVSLIEQVLGDHKTASSPEFDRFSFQCYLEKLMAFQAERRRGLTAR